MDTSTLTEYYLIEAEENIDKLQVDLLALEKDSATNLENFLRAAHSLKGSASLLGFEVSSHAAHIMEDMMEIFKDGSVAPTREHIDFCLELLDIIKYNTDKIANGEEEDPSSLDNVDYRFKSILAKTEHDDSNGDSALFDDDDEMQMLLDDEAPSDDKSFESQPDEAEPATAVEQDDGDDDLSEFYIMEAEENIEKIQHELSEIEKNPAGVNLEAIVRSAHSLKGSGSVLGFNVSSRASHIMEDMLEVFKDNGTAPTQECIDFTKKLFEIIKINTKRIAGGLKEDPSVLEGINQQAKLIFDKLQVGAETPPQPPEEPEVPLVAQEEKIEQVAPVKKSQLLSQPQQAVQSLRIRVGELDDIMNISGELRLRKDSFINLHHRYNSLKDELGQAIISLNRLSKSFKEIIENATPEVKSSQRPFDSLIADFHELEFDDYDESSILWKKLDEATSDLEVLSKELYAENFTFNEFISDLEQSILTLQDSLVNVRVVELAPIFTRFERAVRDICKIENKVVDFSAAGGETKVDTSVLSIIVDPIVQILRNSVAHGIETPDQRKKTGKTERGHIKVEASKIGNDIAIRISDDGKGIDFDKIRSKAIKLGIYSQDDAISDDECLQLIFSPGFSTAEKATHTAGRGIGLDIVQANLARIGGKLKVNSKQGQGATFSLFIPLSLAMASGISVRSGGIEFIIPVSYIVEVTSIFDNEVNAQGNDLTIKYRDEVMELYYLSDILNLPSERVSKEIYVIVVDLGTRKAVLAVDSIIGHEELFIKPLNEFIKGLKFYIGTALSSNGDIRLVLDIFSLFSEDISYKRTVEQIDAAIFQEPRVLVVDDSLSIRKYLSDSLKRINCITQTASNGMEALRILEQETFDLVITDLEMPIMHGYELLTKITTTEGISDIPVVVLTSRGVQKYLDKAYALGAKGYLTKPFKDENLYELIKKLTPYKNW
jgi:chemosensory pili system protein ChpA (sensor histidine kinase/response regulator)